VLNSGGKATASDPDNFICSAGTQGESVAGEKGQCSRVAEEMLASRSMMNFHTFLLSDFTCVTTGHLSDASSKDTTAQPGSNWFQCYKICLGIITNARPASLLARQAAKHLHAPASLDRSWRQAQVQ